jgi:hypothetical protein
MRSQTATEPLGGHINLMVSYVATTWHVNAVLAPTIPTRTHSSVLKYTTINFTLPALLRQIICTFREALKNLSLCMP